MIFVGCVEDLNVLTLSHSGMLPVEALKVFRFPRRGLLRTMETFPALKAGGNPFEPEGVHLLGHHFCHTSTLSWLRGTGGARA